MKAARSSGVAKLALDGLFDGTRVNAGGVLLGPRDADQDLIVSELELIASRTDSDANYHVVSSFLAGTVLREGEAVLAAMRADGGMIPGARTATTENR